MTEAESRRKWPRRIAAVFGLVFLSLVAAFAWNLTSLRGLPDIGDPFDVAAFTTVLVRDEDNEFILYRQAAAKYRRQQEQPASDWPMASAAEQGFLEENREALDLWRRGTERPFASFMPPGELTFESNMDLILDLRSLSRLAFLEGSRLESEGDAQAAWGWYRAALRSSRHCGHRGTLFERLYGTAIHGATSGRIKAWSQRPEVDAQALRRALNEVQAIDSMTSPMSDAVKCEYLSFQEAMARPDILWKFLETAVRDPNSKALDTKTFAKTALLRAEAFLKRDPERSRRLLRLVVANWLAYCGRPLGERPPLDPRHKSVYVPSASVPSNVQLLSPDRMNSWLESTVILRNLLPAFDASRNAIDRERATQAALLIHLASELYRREHGQPPASPEDLVGTYLKELPMAAAPK